MADTRNGNRPAAEADKSQEAEQRRARRLAADLGVNPVGVHVILRLRRQVVALQARVQHLEGALRLEQTRSGTRLAQYRHESQEAIWKDTP